MSGHVYDLGLSLGMYGVMAFAYYGWGRSCGRLLGLGASVPGSPFRFVWLGWAISLLVLHLCHFFVAIDARISLVLFGVGIVFAVPAALRELSQWTEFLVRRNLIFAGALLVSAAWLACKSMAPPLNYDSGLYHFNAIRWINSFRIIPGLGNLHSRLAFNHSFFIYVASLNFFPYFGQGRCIANSFLFLLLLAQALWPALSVDRRVVREASPYSYAAHLFVLPVLCCVGAFQSKDLASPTPDMASMILQLALFVMLCEMICLAPSDKLRTEAAMTTGILAMTAITVKLSNLAFSTVILSVCLFQCLRGLQNKHASKASMAQFAAVLGLTFLAWTGRGIVLSGAPLYPSTFGRVSTDWAMPPDRIKETRNWVYSWAREPGAERTQVLGNWDWLGGWLVRVRSHTWDVVMPLLTAAWTALFFVAVCIHGRMRGRLLPGCADLLPLLAVMAGLLFWFMTAPDPRFAHSLFWLLPIASALPLLSHLHRHCPARMYGVVLAVAFVALNPSMLFALSHTDSYRVTTYTYEAVPEAVLVEKQTRSGLIVRCPAQGDLSWDSPIPSSPYFDPDLRLRGNDIRSGFAIARPSKP